LLKEKKPKYERKDREKYEKHLRCKYDGYADAR
jgi:hypothetical protein